MTTPTPIDILRKAREYVANPKTWTTGHSARDEFGNQVSPTADDATCFCTLGAVERAVFDLTGRINCYLVDETADLLYRRCVSVSAVNDQHGREAALDLIDKVLA